MYGNKIEHLIPAMACLAILMAGTASADVHIGIGFGPVFGPYHPHHHHGWYGGWCAWPDCYWCDPWWDPWPVVVVPPVVVHRQKVVVEEHKPAPPLQKVEKAEPLTEQQLLQRNELVETLKIGDVDNRVQAVRDIEPFARDEKARTALERALSKDRDPQVRKAVAELSSRVRDPKMVPALRRAYAEDDDRDVQQAAYKAIIMIEGYDGL